jgi:hypothetical protein
MDDQTRIRLLGAIESNDLVLLCGAGLSISAPSGLMSAIGVSRACYDSYQAIEPLPPALRDNIDDLAGHFHQAGTFGRLFINRLVPWDELTGRPNAGHAAVGDFLLSGAAAFALSANFDSMIEQWCQSLKVFVRGALDGVEANRFAEKSRPLLKFHGCMQREPETTLWTKPQLQDPVVAARIESCRTWIQQWLPNRHLLVVGFWTDWGYLNAVLSGAIDASTSASVTVIDPKTTAELQAKAPELWATLNVAPHFTHIQGGANEVLAELRLEYSRTWTRKFYQLGRVMFESEQGPCAQTLLDPAGLDVDAIYDTRRDAEGQPPEHAARKAAPSIDAAQAALAHLLVRRAGATRNGAWYTLNNRTIRVVNGAGRALSEVRDRFGQAPAIVAPDIVVCAGAADLGVPANVVRKNAGASIVGPSSGTGSIWLTLAEAREELAI